MNLNKQEIWKIQSDTQVIENFSEQLFLFPCGIKKQPYVSSKKKSSNFTRFLFSERKINKSTKNNGMTNWDCGVCCALNTVGEQNLLPWNISLAEGLLWAENSQGPKHSGRHFELPLHCLKEYK